MDKPSVLFCYLELSTYVLGCMEQFARTYDYHVHVIHLKINSEAPFQFEIDPEIMTLYSEELYDDLLNLSLKISPSLLFCGGWNMPKYLKLARFYKGKIPTVLGFDNKWKGTFKQWALLPFARYRFKRMFDYAFVAGEQQRKFALKMGFPNDRIAKGSYSADVNLFWSIYEQNQKDTEVNNYFLYVGRYLKLKGIYEMWEAFIELQEEKPNNWELICIGTGEEFENRAIHPKIKHIGFVQPKNMPQYIKKGGVYILPSHSEAWSVSTHEMAATGLPMILSNEVGAKEMFLEENKNGFEITAGSKHSIKKAMLKFIQMNEEQREAMRKKSVELSKRITPDMWAEKMNQFITNYTF